MKDVFHNDKWINFTQVMVDDFHSSYLLYFKLTQSLSDQLIFFYILIYEIFH